jgi:hypothetical protein
MFKILILTPMQMERGDSRLREHLIRASGLRQKQGGGVFDARWEFLGDEALYLRDTDDGGLDARRAIAEERNFAPYAFKDFAPGKTHRFQDYEVHCTAHLVADASLNVILVFELEFLAASGGAIDQTLRTLLRQRNILAELGLESEHTDIRLRATHAVLEVMKGLDIPSFGQPPSLSFTLDSSFPLIFASTPHTIQAPEELFLNEEDQEQRRHNSSISLDYPGSYVHVGWNYGVALNLPRNLNQKIFCMVLFLQIYYYEIRFFKDYFQKSLLDSPSRKTTTEHSLESFQGFQIAYRRMILDYKTYKSGLYPKLHKEFTRIEQFWHIPDDIGFITETFELQRDFLDRKFQLEGERINRRQDVALNIIALLEIAALYEVWRGAVELKTEHQDYFWLATLLILLVAAIVAPLIWSRTLGGALERLKGSRESDED